MSPLTRSQMPLTASDLIKQWIEISEGRRITQALVKRLFFRFIACWIAFNAFYTRQYKKSTDVAGVRTAGMDPKLLAIHSDLLGNSLMYAKAVRFFQVAVMDMRVPGDPTKAKKVTNETDWGQVVACVYQVRCNLVHGNKDIDGKRDVDCVRNALRILLSVMQKVKPILPP